MLHIVFTLNLACTTTEKQPNDEQQDVELTFTEEMQINVQEEGSVCSYYRPVNLDWASSGGVLNITKLNNPTPPYEIRGFSLRLLSKEEGFGFDGDNTHSCDTRTPITIFAFVGEEPPAELSDFAISLYEQAIADEATEDIDENFSPYTFPILEKGVSTQISGELGALPELEEGEEWIQEERTELISVIIDEPFLVEDDAQLWIGWALYDDSQLGCACVSLCEEEPISNYSYASGWEESLDNLADIGLLVGH
jgi:hypothetical protein